MKYVILLLQGLLLSQITFSKTDTLKVSSKVTGVTVFFNGAQVTRTANAALTKGKQMVIFEDLPVDLSPASIRVKGCPDCTVQSIEHKINYAIDELPAEKKVRDEINETTYKVKDLANQISVLDIEEQLLHKNNKFSGDEQGAQIDQLKTAADFYGIKINQLRAKRLELIKQMEDIMDTRGDLFEELNKIRAQNKKVTSHVQMTVTTKSAGKRTLKAEYYVHGAGWKPAYDFRVNDVEEPLSIVYNANVYQSSGEDWSNVKLNLSTGNPALSSSKPELEPWYIDKKPQQKSKDEEVKTGSVQGMVTDSRSGDVLPFVKIIIKKDNKRMAGTYTDYSGNFNVKPLAAGTYTLETRYAGHENRNIQNIRIKPNEITTQNIKLGPTQIMMSEWDKNKLPEVERINPGYELLKSENEELNVRGSRADANLYYIDGIKVRGSNNLPQAAISTVSVDGVYKKPRTRISTDYISNTLEQNVSHAEYAIEEPYTILSTGEDYNITIKEVQTELNYTYYAAPKLDGDVFLAARLDDPAELNLLPGKTNIFFAGTFTGESYLPADFLSDTLEISLGRDKNISVQRTGKKEVREKRIFSSTVREKAGWEIKLRNNKSKTVNIVVQDQYPITQKSAISIELLNAEGAEVNKDTGLLEWKLNLEPGKTQTVSFEYEVKYPHEMFE